MKQTVLNLIIKAAFKDTKMKQIGRRPNFFDMENPVFFPGNIKVLKGYKTSAYQTQLGLTLTVDTTSKFMSTKTCLESFKELLQKVPSQRFRDVVEE